MPTRYDYRKDVLKILTQEKTPMGAAEIARSLRNWGGPAPSARARALRVCKDLVAEGRLAVVSRLGDRFDRYALASAPSALDAAEDARLRTRHQSELEVRQRRFEEKVTAAEREFFETVNEPEVERLPRRPADPRAVAHARSKPTVPTIQRDKDSPSLPPRDGLF